MEEFIKYKKIHRLGKDEVDGILEHDIVVQEKIDGANASIWNDKGAIKIGSRNGEISDGFNGFREYVQKHEGINKYLKDNPTHRLFGEWLVKHTIKYNDEAYKEFYLFDIYKEDGLFLDTKDVDSIAKKYNIKHPQIFLYGKYTRDEIMEYVGKTELGERGEGVVIKSRTFVNKYGNNAFAKIVADTFKETKRSVQVAENKWEEYIVEKYCTKERVQKIMNKLQNIIDEKLSYEHIPRISVSVYNDIITEDMWEIAKKVEIVNFKTLRSLCSKHAASLYKGIIEQV